MIGQLELKNRIVSQIEDNTFPRFSILVGQPGSGKKMMCGFIATHLHAVKYTCGVGVDDIRKMISEAYKISTKVLYVIADADKMSIASKNAMLKVTEEPPQNAYFVMTLADANNTLNTIRSRGTVYHMNPYSIDELLEYGKMKTNYTLHDDQAKIIRNICENPGEIDMLFGNSDPEYARDFYSYAEKVVDNVAVVSGANSFKIGDKIAFKATDDKYDLRLFWKAFMAICADRLSEDPFKYAGGVRVTSKYLQDLRITGINKQSTFDMWLLDIRQEWMN